MAKPRFAQLMLEKLVDLKEDGSFHLDQSYFNYGVGLTMTNDKFAALFGEPVRGPEQLLTQFHMDTAASIQAVTEEIVLRLARSVRAETGMKNLCLAGGVALNCVANGKLLREGIFEACGSSRRRAMPAARWERRSRAVISSTASRARWLPRATPCAAAISARNSARPRSRLS